MADPIPPADQGIDLGDLLRRLRRRADLSQRELAARAGLPQSAVARIESGRATDPRYRTIERLVRAAGGGMGVEFERGHDTRATPSTEPGPVPHDDMRDQAGRHYPAHLDVWKVCEPRDWPGAWWAEWYALPPRLWPLPLPPASYRLNRDYRDERRARARVRRSVTVRRVTGPTVPATAWRFVAEIPGGELIGELRAHDESPHLRWGDGLPLEEPEAVLDGVLVMAAYRRLGIGRRLVDALIAAIAASRGAVCVRALTEQAGIDFLHACGFEIEASRPAAMRFDQTVSGVRRRRW
ncbi:GNAT family N-acetyltransferase [Micromonospora sp. WMMC241]|uniref:GNAT family N-acetyltransferase n=1 Tax=Micromonospora sp. WMMC241 TaxID=3015159 RepID=UPI0022B6458F|nr:GNAT family N-acetyltransferase [Micromonospora sp. WMMC241]MCZ7440154.1 GNAT family N-acetyltransferase [Micromonospora sp. WMMC241]